MSLQAPGTVNGLSGKMLNRRRRGGKREERREREREKNLIQIIFTPWAPKCKSQIKEVWTGNEQDWEGISSSRGYIYVCWGCETDMLEPGNGGDPHLNTNLSASLPAASCYPTPSSPPPAFFQKVIYFYFSAPLPFPSVSWSLCLLSRALHALAECAVCTQADLLSHRWQIPLLRVDMAALLARRRPPVRLPPPGLAD